MNTLKGALTSAKFLKNEFLKNNKHNLFISRLGSGIAVKVHYVEGNVFYGNHDYPICEVGDQVLVTWSPTHEVHTNYWYDDEGDSPSDRWLFEPLLK